MRRAIPFTALILVAALVLSGFSSQEVVSGRRRATASSPPSVHTYCAGSVGTTSPATVNCTTPSAPNIGASGDSLVLWVYADGAVTLGSPSGCATWGAAKATYSSTNQMYFWVAAATASGSCTPTISGTFTGTHEITIYMWDTQNTLTTVDGTAGLTFTSFCTSCTTPNTAATSTSSSGGLALAVARNPSLTAWTGSWTGLTTLSPNGLPIPSAYQVQSGSGAIYSSWTSSGNSSYNGIIVIKHS